MSLTLTKEITRVIKKEKNNSRDIKALEMKISKYNRLKEKGIISDNTYNISRTDTIGYSRFGYYN